MVASFGRVFLWMPLAGVPEGGDGHRADRLVEDAPGVK
jgi:hypothetical protein